MENKDLEMENNKLKEKISFLEKQNEMLKKLAYTDELTSLYNRRTLSYVNNSRVNFLAMCDLDNFKQINDKFGHQVGDRVLKDVSDIMTNTISSSDTLIRYGGDEFLILSCDGDSNDFFSRIESMRKKIKEKNDSFHISMSFAVGIHDFDNPLSDSIKLVDDALYASKDKGGNCVTYVDETLKKEKEKK